LQPVLKIQLKIYRIMKKILLVVAACMTIAMGFTSCKVETSEVTVNVTDRDGFPIANREVYYTDMASVIVSGLTPDPSTPITGSDGEELAYGKTDAFGTVTFRFDLAVENLDYYFYVFDEGSRQWRDKTVHLRRGKNAEITFEVNQ